VDYDAVLAELLGFNGELTLVAVYTVNADGGDDHPVVSMTSKLVRGWPAPSGEGYLLTFESGIVFLDGAAFTEAHWREEDGRRTLRVIGRRSIVDLRRVEGHTVASPSG
jgi:hypothetical protein